MGSHTSQYDAKIQKQEGEMQGFEEKFCQKIA